MYVCESCIDKFISGSMQNAADFLERKDKFDWFLSEESLGDWKRKLFRIEIAHFRLENGNEIEDGKKFVLLMERFGLMKSIMNVKNVNKRNETIKESLKKYVVSKSWTKKPNAKEQEKQMNYFLHVISQILQLRYILTGSVINILTLI